jgi:DNA-binding protein Fis
MIQGIRSFVEERASTSKRKENDTDIFKMTEKEMIEYHQKPYLEGLLKRTAGNQTEAAKIACLPLNTFRDHCKKYGLS